MARRVNGVLQQLRLSLALHEASTLSDAHLLRRWAAERDEAAFELLVRRHGPMVLGVCRRLLGHVQDAEDAFQATFLALVRKADSIHKQAAVSSWLYKVAYRVALRARTRSASRPVCGVELTDLAGDPPQEYLWSDLRRVLDEEVSQLPSCYRDVFILCHLQGKTNEEASRQLGCPLGTVVSRLSRARQRLRAQLIRRGLTLSAGVVASAGFAEVASAALTPALVETTSRIALAYVGGGAEAAAVIPAQVTSLTNGVLKIMFLTKLKIAAAIVLALCLSGMGTYPLVYQSTAGAQEGVDSGPTPGETKPAAEKNWQILATFEDPEDWVRSLAFTPDGRHLASGNQGGTIYFLDLVDVNQGVGHFQAGKFQGGGQEFSNWINLKAVRKLAGVEGGVANLAYSPDGHLLAVAEKSGAVVLRDAETGRITWSYQVKNGGARLTFTPDSQFLVVNGEDALLFLDPRTGKSLRKLVARFHSPDAGVTFTPDGKVLITGGTDSSVRLWDATTGKAVARLKVPSRVLTVAASPDGKQLVAAGEDGTVRLLDLASGRWTRALLGHTGRVSSVAFSPDGKILASGGADKTIRLWDVATGQQVQLKQHQGPILILVFSPDGKILASAGGDRKVVLWRSIVSQAPAKMLNKVGVGDPLDRLVKSLVQEKKSNKECVEALYLATLARYPTEVERNFLLKELARAQDRSPEKLEDILWSLVNTKEFRAHLEELKGRDPGKNLDSK